MTTGPGRMAEQETLFSGNMLLGSLRAAERLLLAPYLVPSVCRRGDILFGVGEDVSVISFPCDGTVTTLSVVTRDGRTVETATIGREGAIGGVVSQGFLPAYTQAVVQIGGPLVRVNAARVQEVKQQSTAVRNLFTRYSDCLLAQVLQNVACNALHPIDQRCARWLLTVQDKIGGDSLPITHETLAEMLGGQRTYVTRILGGLQDQGLIEVKRGRVTILDRTRLAAAACECRDSVAAHFERVLGRVYPAEDQASAIVSEAARHSADPAPA